ncbi:MAG: MarC family protein [Victivallaceae bacterium]
MTENYFISAFIKLFFLLTPFFVLSMFIAVTGEMSNQAKRHVALKTSAANLIVCFFIYFFGEYLFRYLGITLDAFRIGAGIILMITAIDLVLGKNKSGVPTDDEVGDISVVPLAIPYAIGPGTIGALLVMGGEAHSGGMKLAHSLAIAAAVILVAAILLLSAAIERVIGKKGIHILSKVTGLMLAALASQIIFTGIKNFLFVSK